MKISETKISIKPDSVLLDIVSRWPDAETVIRRYDEQVGVCLCCTCRFD